MTLLQPKIRLVTIRLRQPDYEAIKSACTEEGARSISEFARRAVLNELARSGITNVTFADDLRTLTMRLQDLDRAIKDASARIWELIGPEQSATPSQREGPLSAELRRKA